MQSDFVTALVKSKTQVSYGLSSKWQVYDASPGVAIDRWESGHRPLSQIFYLRKIVAGKRY